MSKNRITERIFHHTYYSNCTFQNDAIVYEIMKRQEAIDAIERVENFSFLDEFFSSEQNKYHYEGAYNSYMYIKDYLFGLLEHYTFTMQEIINDTAKKSEIVSLYLEEICDYLYNIRTTIDKSRLSTCNNRTILRIIKQQEISEQERKYLTELLAFGIGKENLENKNFKSLERLIYISRNKPKKPKF